MIGFISTLVTISLLITLKYRQYSAIIDLYTFHFTVAHALGFSVLPSRLLATDLNTESITSDHYEFLLPFLVQSLWNSAALNTELPVAVFHQELTRKGTALLKSVKVKVTLLLTIGRSVSQ
jgi:hypothetical protein